MNRILTFIIGLLCGTIITTLGFMIYLKRFQGEMMDMKDNGGMYRPQPNEEIGNPPEMPNGKMPMDRPEDIQNYFKK